MRGPRGGYELAREQARITADDILRAAATAEEEQDMPPLNGSTLLCKVVLPALAQAERAFGAALENISVEELVRSTEIVRKMAE
jgi:DNA-binding IscR family transcriptional regulator